MSDSSPRSARTKKKSTLSRLADRKGKSNNLAVSDESDMNSSRNSLQDNYTSQEYSHDRYRGEDNSWQYNHRSSPKYPLDAQVEISHNDNSDMEDSDEGVEVGGYNNRGNHSSRLPADGTLHRLQSLNVDSSISQNEYQGRYNDYDLKGEKRFRDQNSDGDDMAKETLRTRFRKQASTRLDSDEESPDDTLSRTKRTPESLRRSFQSEVRSSHKTTNDEDDVDYAPRNMSSRFKPYDSLRTSNEDLTNKYRKMLESSEKRYDDHDVAEKMEMEDDVPDLKHRFGSPRHSALSPTPPMQRKDYYSESSVIAQSSSGYGPQALRPWSADKARNYNDEMMSQRSLASTSVLNLISTKEARNRSFLEGSINTHSLLGADELERFFPDRKMRIFVGTWNMCEMKLIPECLDDFVLPETSDYIHDMYVIGTQESVSNRKDWEIKLQETLGPQHVLFHSAAFGVLFLNIFIRRDLIWFCSVSEEDSISTRGGPSGIKTKGGLGVSFTFFGTSFLFVNCHLTPHDGKIKERIADYNKICAGLKIPKVVVNPTYAAATDDVTSRFDCVFWMGDTNFRLEKERERVDHKVRGIESDDASTFDDLQQYDELFRARNECKAFQDFQEGRIKFKPTYKYNLGTNDYDTSAKMRIPSYTDRILFRCKKKHAVSCLYYDSAQDVMASDHKPVYGMFEVAIRPGRDNIPLSAGQFSRDVWLEANKKRAARFTTKDHKSSSVCSVQ